MILTVRDTTETWCEAVERTVWYVHQLSPFAKGKILGSSTFERCLPDLFRMGKRMFECIFDDDVPRTAAQVYQEHNDRIMRLVPPERLLVFNVKKGWSPLCRFLGQNVSEEMEGKGFPRLNDSQAFIDKVTAKQAMMRRRLAAFAAGISAAGVALAYSIFAISRWCMAVR